MTEPAPHTSRLSPISFLERGATAVVAYRPLAHVLDAALAQLGDAAPRVIWVEDGAGESCAYEALLRDAAPARLEHPLDENALLSINYTSGTTGRPKGVMTSH